MSRVSRDRPSRALRAYQAHVYRMRQQICEEIGAIALSTRAHSQPLVLARDPATKTLEVGKLANRKPWPRVPAEIEKCDVRCASCHRKRTAEQFGWRRALMQPRWNGDVISQAVSAPTPPPTDVVNLSDQRRCSTCGVTQPIEQFAVKNARTGQRSTKCRSCQRSYSRNHYLSNRDDYLEKARRRRKTERDRFTELILEYFAGHPCVDCGATDPRILDDLDHRDGVRKVAAVSALIRALNWRGLVVEIAKCDVRCANCHRRRTALQFSYARLQISEDGAAA